MKIHNKDILTATRATVPRTVVRSKTYRNLVGQWFLGPCGSNEYHNESIVEEDENIAEHMAEESPIQVQRLANYGTDDEDWRAERNDDFSDKEDEEDDVDIEEANLQQSAPNQPSTSITNINRDPPEIKVTSVDSLHQMAQVYRENFDGFAEINKFHTIEAMHEFIKNILEHSPPCQEAQSSDKQDRYLDLLFNEKPEDRFRRLFEISRSTVRRILARNEDILQDLFTYASLDNFPSPLASSDDFEPILSDDEDEDANVVPLNDSNAREVEENMKRWYMIEMIGLWLRIITDVKSYRQAIKNNLLKKRWGIENDRYDGIAVPLKYK